MEMEKKGVVGSFCGRIEKGGTQFRLQNSPNNETPQWEKTSKSPMTLKLNDRRNQVLDTQPWIKWTVW